jgi:hypothetical protein
MIISKTGKKQWTNRHETFTQNIDNLYNLADNNTSNILADYNDATAGIQSIIQEAITQKKGLRVLGGEWSWSKITGTDGILLNSKPLNISFTINKNNLSNQYKKLPEDLYFAQCGVSIKELNERLAKRNRAIKTSGASNGQTIAGAMSTGTHGSKLEFGAVSDFVVGIHIVVSPTRHVWLERASYPVVSDSFLKAINAELVRDDKIFNAAAVSFGSFGFIHGVMIETVPLFLYESYRLRLPIDDKFTKLLETLDFKDSQLPCGSEKPLFFQVVLNPYDLDKGAYINVMYNRPYTPGYPPSTLPAGIGPGDDAPAFIGKVAQGLPALVPGLINQLVKNSFPLFGKTLGIHGEMFTNTDVRGKVLSTAFGITIQDVNRVRQTLLDVNKTHGPVAGVISIRYVKKSTATLGFTRFDTTCVIELDCAFSDATSNFFKAVWAKLDELKIPFTFHWGKIFKLDAATLKEKYGAAAVEDWINARNTLMKSPESMQVFTNQVMKEMGLDRINKIV